MRAGKLDRSITIERLTETVSDTGGVASAWTTTATIRAEIVNQTASEFLTGYGEAEAGTIVFRIRYRADITTADRITYAGRQFNIKEVAEIGRRRWLELRAISVS